MKYKRLKYDIATLMFSVLTANATRNTHLSDLTHS